MCPPLNLSLPRERRRGGTWKVRNKQIKRGRRGCVVVVVVVGGMTITHPYPSSPPPTATLPLSSQIPDREALSTSSAVLPRCLTSRLTGTMGLLQVSTTQARKQTSPTDTTHKHTKGYVANCGSGARRHWRFVCVCVCVWRCMCTCVRTRSPQDRTQTRGGFHRDNVKS